MEQERIIEMIRNAKNLKIDFVSDMKEVTKPGDQIRSYKQKNVQFIITGKYFPPEPNRAISGILIVKNNNDDFS